MTIETMWMGKMQFNALVDGHAVVMDAPERAGGEETRVCAQTEHTFSLFCISNAVA